MRINAKFAHYNFNVMDLERSIRFYKEALGFEPMRRKEAKDGSFILTYLGDGESAFYLELTWMRDWDRPYDLGDNEVHLAVTVSGDYAAVREYHRQMNCICYENESMGLYFIADPDGYWIEVLSDKR